MVQQAWIALIIVGVLVIAGIVLYLVLGRSSSSTAVLIPVFPPNGYNPHPNGYNPELNPGPGSYPNGYNPSLPPGPGPLPAAHATGYNPNLTPSTSHSLLPGVTTKDLSEAFASPL